MRKIIGFIFAIIAFAIGFSACSTDTYADKLKKETEAINRFLSDNGISVINTYPEGGIFKSNEYFKDAGTGVYIHVINPGNADKPIKGKTTVYLRYENVINLLTKDTLDHSNNTPGRDIYPMEFEYGKTSTYTYPALSSPTLLQYQMYMFLSPSCVLPLDYGLGNNAEVSLIVPFLNGSTMQSQSTQYMPIYFQKLTYRFIVDKLD